MRRLLLIRHGLPDYRVRAAGDEIPGPPLSALGCAQARQAAAVVARAPVATVYSSPLSRTRMTAELIAATIARPVRVAVDLREWHRSETLHAVGARLARWLVGWLRGREECAAVVSHASPLLALLRTALYLPHVGWWRPGRPEALELSSGDRFEVTMASVFELTFTPARVSARGLFHPEPRIHHLARGRHHRGLPRPVPGLGENRVVERPNWLRLLGAAGCLGSGVCPSLPLGLG